MILSALASYFDILRELHPDEIPPCGWSYVRVGTILVLSPDGTLRGVIPSPSGEAVRKLVPERSGRSNDTKPYLLCDTAEYILGIDVGGGSKRATKRFESSRGEHMKFLEGVDSDCARAVCSFFELWDPAAAGLCEELDTVVRNPKKSGNLLLAVSGPSGEITFASEDDAIVDAWNRKRDLDVCSSKSAICLVSGEMGPIAKKHPQFQGIPGAQSSGAALVSFNGDAFESYGKKQGDNAPVSQKVVDEYGAVLTYLLQSDEHRALIGGTRLVFWSPVVSEASSKILAEVLNPISAPSDSDEEPEQATASETEALVCDILHKASSGKYVDLAGVGVDLNTPFYVLGLSGNEGRLVVRLFLSDEFGNILANLLDHYRITAVSHAAYKADHVSPLELLESIEKPSEKKPKKPSKKEEMPPLALTDGLLEAILQGTRYPESLYERARSRCLAERHVGRERAAIIRGCLIRNHNFTEEEMTVALNENRTTTPYLLGRAFALLEWIQEEANGSKSISGNYLRSACASPATVFPALLKRGDAHMKKIARDKPQLSVYLARQLDAVLSSGTLESFPRQLDIVEQGEFLLALHQQRQKRYEKKGTDRSDGTEDEEA